MARKALRAVGDDEPRRVNLSVRDALDRSPREMLIALRNKIATDIDKGVPAHALAPLTRRLMEIMHDIETIDAEAEDDDASAVADEAFDPAAV